MHRQALSQLQSKNPGSVRESLYFLLQWYTAYLPNLMQFQRCKLMSLAPRRYIGLLTNCR
jgi:hypothetical protein